MSFAAAEVEEAFVSTKLLTGNDEKHEKTCGVVITVTNLLIINHERCDGRGVLRKIDGVV